MSKASPLRVRIDLAIIAVSLVVAMVTRVEAVSQAMRNAALGVSLGTAAMYLIVAFLHRGAFPKILVKFLVFATLLVAIYTVSVIHSPNKGPALITIVQLSLILSWVLFVSFVPWTATAIRLVYELTAVFIIVNFALWSIEGFNMNLQGT